jgi:hypothetical protein
MRVAVALLVVLQLPLLQALPTTQTQQWRSLVATRSLPSKNGAVRRRLPCDRGCSPLCA